MLIYPVGSLVGAIQLVSNLAQTFSLAALTGPLQAGLACLAEPEICVKRRASDAQVTVGEQPSQHK